MNAYELNQLASGIKVGDTVRVTGTSESFNRGWECNWHSLMDEHVGKFYIVLRVDSTLGMKLQNYWFPYFVLEKVV